MSALKLEAKAAVNWDVCKAIDDAQGTIAKVYWGANAKAVVTSARDGKHSRQTAHNDGNAIDLRITNLFPDRKNSNKAWYGKVLEFAYTLSQSLQALRSPGRFDVVLEGTHIHLEHSVNRTPNIIGWEPDRFVYCNAAVREIIDPKGAV